MEIVSGTTRKVFDGFNTLCAERYEHQCGYTRNVSQFVLNTEFSSLCIETSLGVRRLAAVWLGISISDVSDVLAASVAVVQSFSIMS